MRFRFAVTIGLGTVLGAAGLWADETSPARLVAAYEWAREEPWFGGFSGLEIDQDGARFLVVNDQGRLVEGVFERDREGRILGITVQGSTDLRNTQGDVPRAYERNSEGLARGDSGGPFFVSFEGGHKVEAFARPDAAAQALPDLPALEIFDRNESLEALAIDAQGRLVLVSEAEDQDGAGFPLWRLEEGAWRKIDSIPARGLYRPVGADFGPDRRLYLLERRFDLIGFSSRVRRFDIAGDALTNEAQMLRSRTGAHDNLEGLAVWRGEDGLIRLTMVSDDNFVVLQRTEIVEYVVTENP